MPNVKKPHHPLLVVDVARYVGEPVAAVLADDPMRAADALELIETEWQALPAVTSVEEALDDSGAAGPSGVRHQRRLRRRVRQPGRRGRRRLRPG